MYTFQGYPRPDGSVGIRNHVVVISTVACVNGTVDAIARKVPGVVPIVHAYGCGRLSVDLPNHFRVLAGICKNPNVAAVLAIGLGCEFIKVKNFADAVAASGKPVEYLNVQTDGGSVKVMEKGAEIAKKLLADAAKIGRQTFGMEKIVLGLECGGSDALSGVTANPATGIVTDWVVENGGTAIISEITEFIGTQAIMRTRCATPEIGDQLVTLIDNQQAEAEKHLGPAAMNAAISPGNMDGGMSTIAEKSLGCICKAGSSPVQEVVPYGTVPTRKGLIVMDGPGYDFDSVAGEASSGCNIMIFTTGRGNPLGFPVMPVIKVASNTALYHAMPDDMDANAGRMLDEGLTLQQMGGELIELTKRIIAGEKTKAELNQHDDCIGIECYAQSF
jgi:altronate dehydratase large subunit